MSALDNVHGFRHHYKWLPPQIESRV